MSATTSVQTNFFTIPVFAAFLAAFIFVYPTHAFVYETPPTTLSPEKKREFDEWAKKNPNEFKRDMKTVTNIENMFGGRGEGPLVSIPLDMPPEKLQSAIESCMGDIGSCPYRTREPTLLERMEISSDNMPVKLLNGLFGPAVIFELVKTGLIDNFQALKSYIGHFKETYDLLFNNKTDVSDDELEKLKAEAQLSEIEGNLERTKEINKRIADYRRRESLDSEQRHQEFLRLQQARIAEAQQLAAQAQRQKVEDEKSYQQYLNFLSGFIGGMAQSYRPVPRRSSQAPPTKNYSKGKGSSPLLGSSSTSSDVPLASPNASRNFFFWP